VEVGIDQAPDVKQLFEAAGFTDLFTARDTQEIERVVGGRIT